MYQIFVFIAKVLFKIFYKVDVKDKIKLEKDKGYMICSNHIHMFDPAFIACFTNRKIYFMSKKEIFEKRFFNWLFRKLGAFPVDREKPDLESIRTAVGKLKDKCVVGIFPEGTRSKTGQMGEFKAGAGFIAMKGNVSIIPVKIEGTYKLFSRIKLKVGEEIHILDENREALMNRVKLAISVL